ncbi:unnamed protein product [Caenorhabditis bovis]|uniref:Fibronectin type-III domain-containing protein n=1 Tax=Caenorhabditis bovis TaxID=2654633 RepID=A0A8S1EKZ5_9PELO|nr:unnamed protein product [Caenorhabditis bovis]
MYVPNQIPFPPSYIPSRFLFQPRYRQAIPLPAPPTEPKPMNQPKKQETQYEQDLQHHQQQQVPQNSQQPTVVSPEQSKGVLPNQQQQNAETNPNQQQNGVDIPNQQQQQKTEPTFPNKQHQGCLTLNHQNHQTTSFPNYQQHNGNAFPNQQHQLAMAIPNSELSELQTASFPNYQQHQGNGYAIRQQPAVVAFSNHHQLKAGSHLNYQQQRRLAAFQNQQYQQRYLAMTIAARRQQLAFVNQWKPNPRQSSLLGVPPLFQLPPGSFLPYPPPPPYKYLPCPYPHGPATIKMVGDMGGMPLVPFPITVPPGHQCHQIVDELGILRHVVLSIEPNAQIGAAPPETNVEQTNGTSPGESQPQEQRACSGPSIIYNNNGKWIPANPEAVLSLKEKCGIDTESGEKLRETLKQVTQPHITRALTTNGDINWKSAEQTPEKPDNKGLYPSLDTSEYTYQTTAIEPKRQQYVQPYITTPTRPDPPHMLRVVNKGYDFVHLIWKSGNNNGAAIYLYYVYVLVLHKSGIIDGATFCQFDCCEGKILGLKPSTNYRFCIKSVNAIGESYESALIDVGTKSDRPPPTPNAPAVTSVTHRAVRLMWLPLNECVYGLEQNDVNRQIHNVIRERLTGTTIQIGNLQPDSEYHFRLFAKNNEGESERSDWTVVRTQLPRHYNHHNHYYHSNHYETPARVPSTPIFLRYVNRKPEVGWKISLKNHKDLVFNLEGSTYINPEHFFSIYRGSATTYVIAEDDIYQVRVQSISKRGLKSDFTNVLIVPRIEKEELAAPDKPKPPRLMTNKMGTLRIIWDPVEYPNKNFTVFYRLQRIDDDETAHDIYTGPNTEILFNDEDGDMEISLRLKSFILANEVPIDSDWSEVITRVTPRRNPKPPTDLHYDREAKEICWDCPDEWDDLRFDVEISSEDGVIVHEEKRSKRYCMDCFAPGFLYKCVVYSIHDDGKSNDPAIYEFIMPAEAPGGPEPNNISPEGTDKLTVRWTPGNSHGNPTSDYRFKIFEKDTMVREFTVPANSYFEEYTINDLKPNTAYRIELRAENQIGQSPPAFFNGKTKSLPPTPPKLECEPEPTAIRLRWKTDVRHTAMSYKLVRIKDGQQITIYEGENLTSKVKNLTQDTEYEFQIRASNKLTGTSVWSPVYKFRTSLAPPPPIRTCPTVTKNNGKRDLYTIQWTDVLQNTNEKTHFYRLQVVESTDPKAKWNTVYEGNQTVFTLKTNGYKGPIQVRVFCVRIHDKGETRGHESPITFIMNDQEETEQKPISQKSDDLQIYYGKIRKCLLPIAALISFIIVALLLVTVCDILFNMTQNTPITEPVYVPPAPPIPTPPPTTPPIPSKQYIPQSTGHLEY